MREKHGHESFPWILKTAIFGISPENERSSLERGKMARKESEEKFFELKTNARLAMLKKARPPSVSVPSPCHPHDDENIVMHEDQNNDRNAHCYEGAINDIDSVHVEKQCQQASNLLQPNIT